MRRNAFASRACSCEGERSLPRMIVRSQGQQYCGHVGTSRSPLSLWLGGMLQIRSTLICCCPKGDLSIALWVASFSSSWAGWGIFRASACGLEYASLHRELAWHVASRWQARPVDRACGARGKRGSRRLRARSLSRFFFLASFSGSAAKWCDSGSAAHAHARTQFWFRLRRAV